MDPYEIIDNIKNSMFDFTTERVSHNMPTLNDISSFGKEYQDAGSTRCFNRLSSMYNQFMDWYKKDSQSYLSQPKNTDAASKLESTSSMYDKYITWYENICQTNQEQPENSATASQLDNTFLPFDMFSELCKNRTQTDQGRSGYSSSCSSSSCSSASSNESEPVNTSTNPELKTAEAVESVDKAAGTVKAGAEAAEAAVEANEEKAQAPEDTKHREGTDKDKGHGNGKGLELKTYGITQNFTELISDVEIDDKAQGTVDLYEAVSGLSDYSLGDNITDDAAPVASAGATDQTDK